jgi:hypothetical protein
MGASSSLVACGRGLSLDCVELPPVRAGATGPDALAATVGTAGRAVAFSDLTVGIGLCELLFFQGVWSSSSCGGT